MRVEIWSDITCPWCYVGLARFSRALGDFEQRAAVRVQHRSFELAPDAPRGPGVPVVDMLAGRYGRSREQILTAERKLAGLAAEEGLGYTPDRTTGTTFDTHRLLHFARTQGLERDLRTAIWQAHFAGGRPVFAAAELQPIAESVGLPATEVAGVLGDIAFADAVRSDEGRAAALGVDGVPFFVLGDVDGPAQAFALSGAQPLETFELALAKAWEADRPTP